MKIPLKYPDAYGKKEIGEVIEWDHDTGQISCRVTDPDAKKLIESMITNEAPISMSCCNEPCVNASEKIKTNCDSSYDRRDCFKLLSLFGRSDGDLEWRLNQYSDGSGCGSTVYPCTSYDQALDIVREWFAEKAKTDLENMDKDRGNKPSLSIIEKAKEYAITMPDEYIKSAHEIDKKLRANKIKKLQEEINALIAKETEVEEALF